tara:strand:- start:249 stop:425 length:177 start_codon:yes stop_codon:yes gene_type:complete
MKSTPNLPASSRMQMPSGGGPSIKGALKVKAFGMAGGVPSKGAIKGAGKGAKKKMMNK